MNPIPKEKVLRAGKRFFTLQVFLAVLIVFSLFLHAQVISVATAESSVSFSDKPLKQRGIIYDRNGIRVADNTSSYAVILTKDWQDQEESLKSKFPTGSKLSNSDFVIGTTNDLAKAWALLAEYEAYKPEIRPVVQRRYEARYGLGTLLGYVGLPAAKDLERGYTGLDMVGKAGLEAAWDEQLGGVSSANGDNLVLTIDANWQAKLANLVSNQVAVVENGVGAAAIMRADTGELMAYVSYPNFDNQEFSSGLSADRYNQYLTDPHKPLLDKVAGLQGPPGSAFKLVAALELLEQGIIDRDSSIISTGCIYLGGYPFCEYAQHYLGELNIVSALETSSNIFFCENLSKSAAEGKLSEYISRAQEFGFGTAPAVEWAVAAAGIFPTPEAKKARGENWYQGDTCNTVIGQGEVTVSPLQMLMMVGAVANGGKVLQPRAVMRVEDQAGNNLEATEPIVLADHPVSAEQLSIVHEGMFAVTHGERGTDRFVLGQTEIPVWAKTGTAEAGFVDGNGQVQIGVHGWVVGFFDYAGVRYAFVTHMPFAGGAWNATPIMKGFLDCLALGMGSACG